MRQIDDFEMALRAYPQIGQPLAIESLGASGGLSGARFWRLATADGRLCLRRWPGEQADADRLAWIHRVLKHVASRGFTRLPLPLTTREGQTWTQCQDHLWQLEPWLLGKADRSPEPRPKKLAAAMTALAEFHAAASDFPLIEPPMAPAPGIRRRYERLVWWTETGIGQLVRTATGSSPDDSRLILKVVRLFERGSSRVQALLDEARQICVPLAPCIRDIWHDNVLFIGEQVSGIVDFGAMQPDSRAADVARLLGSMAQDDPAGWQVGLASYQSTRRLSEDEMRLVEAFDRANSLLSALNWTQWLYLERRQFDNLNQVSARLLTAVARMDQLAAGSIHASLRNPN